MIAKFFYKQDQASFDGIRKAILLCFFLASLFAVFIVLTLISFLDQREEDSILFNLVGRQRTLSEKLCNDIDYLRSNGALQNDIKADIVLWDSIHTTLKSEGGKGGILRKENPNIDLLFKTISPFQKKLIQFSNTDSLTAMQLVAPDKWEKKIPYRDVKFGKRIPNGS